MPLWIKSSASALPAFQQSPSHISRIARIACGRHIASMSTDTKQQKNAKFGHLPLSTSGPQETSLTVRHDMNTRSSSHTTDTLSRAMHFYEHPTSTRARPSPKKSAMPSSFMASFLPMFKPLTSRSSAHTPSTPPDRAISPRTLS